MKYRRTNGSCITCGSQIPKKAVEVSGDDDEEIYECPDCGSEILRGVIATGGDVADTNVMLPPGARHHLFPTEISWDTIEVWWTDMLYVIAVHGRVVDGTRPLYQYVRRVKERLGES